MLKHKLKSKKKKKIYFFILKKVFIVWLENRNLVLQRKHFNDTRCCKVPAPIRTPSLCSIKRGLYFRRWCPRNIVLVLVPCRCLITARKITDVECSLSGKSRGGRKLLSRNIPPSRKYHRWEKLVELLMP